MRGRERETMFVWRGNELAFEMCHTHIHQTRPYQRRKKKKRMKKNIVTHIYSHVSFAHFNAFAQKDLRLFIWLLVRKPTQLLVRVRVCARAHLHIFQKLDLFHFYSLCERTQNTVPFIYSSFKQYFIIHSNVHIHTHSLWTHSFFVFFSFYLSFAQPRLWT